MWIFSAAEHVGLFADGAAVKYVGEETFRLCQMYVDEMVLVDTDAICAAIKDVFEDTRAVLEPAGALAVAGAKAYAASHRLKDRTLVATASGANLNFDRLRHIAERAEIVFERVHGRGHGAGRLGVHDEGLDLDRQRSPPLERDRDARAADLVLRPADEQDWGS